MYFLEKQLKNWINVAGVPSKKNIKENNFHFGATTFEWSKFQKKIAQKNE